MSATIGSAGAGAGTTTDGPESRLNRVLGLPALVFFGLAYMVPLTVWTTYGLVTTDTEGHLPAAYLATTIAMLLTAWSYGRMVVAQPTAGSAYSYASRAFGRPLGFMVGWALLLDYIFLPMINYLLIGLYMNDYFPGIDDAYWIVLAVVLVTALNILGIRLLTNMNLLLVATQFVFIAVFAVMAIVHIGGDEVSVRSWTDPIIGGDAGLIFAGAAVLALSFLGFDAVSTLSEETHDPTRVIPRAILLCALAGGGLYLFQSYLGHLAFPDWASFGDDVDVASADVMKEIGNDFLNSFFTAAYVAGAFACAMASQASVSRILFAMGRDGSLPKPIFARLHPTYRTPVVANVIVGLFGLTALFITLATVSSMISFGALAAFSFVNLAVIKTYVIDRGERGGAALVKYALIPFAGFLFTIYLWTKLSRDTFEIGLPWLAVGFVYLLILTRMFTKPPPAMYDADADEIELESAPKRA
ncbi:MAG TPA: APC family permease [Solirubrobacteraceae bacterium]|nr:APC family permease [Solirubrobacteraceae bacterium]